MTDMIYDLPEEIFSELVNYIPVHARRINKYYSNLYRNHIALLIVRKVNSIVRIIPPILGFITTYQKGKINVYESKIVDSGTITEQKGIELLPDEHFSIHSYKKVLKWLNVPDSILGDVCEIEYQTQLGKYNGMWLYSHYKRKSQMNRLYLS